MMAEVATTMRANSYKSKMIQLMSKLKQMRDRSI